MMPPEQSTKPVAASTDQTISIQIELPSSTSNVAPCPNNQNRAPLARSSALCQSLPPITLKFEDVTYTIKLQTRTKNCISPSHPKPTRTILNGVTGIAHPGELVALLGPSGSGKTTLLTALAGRLPGKISGTITYNNRPFSTTTKRQTGFVTQDDILYPHLTVLETLTYAALLKLPSSLTKSEKRDQAESIIVELGLTRCRNSMIGGPMLRGLSGGERKRVSVGQEMVVNPSVLLVDEATSGLDSTAAVRIVAALRRVAGGGRTVVATVHQPSSRLFRMFDKAVVLCEGWCVYSGGVDGVMDYFGAIGFVPGFGFVNPADFVLDLANGVTPDSGQDDENDFNGTQDHPDALQSTKQFLIHSYKKNIYPLLKQELHLHSLEDQPHSQKSSPSSPTTASENQQWSSSWWLQFRVLLSRGLKERRHESYSGLRIFQVMSVSILSGLLWWHSDPNHIQDQVGLLFFFSIFWGFFPLFNAIFVFPQERPMLARERSSGMYRLSSYYTARIIGDLPMELVLPTIFVIITYWMGGLKPSLITFLETLAIILLNVLVAQGLGLALGAILMDVKQATTLSSVLMLLFLLASGYYIQHMPPFIDWFKYISFSHYCYKLLVGVQYSVYECRSGPRECVVLDFPAIKYLEIRNMASDVVALMAMLVGFRVLAYVALRLANQKN